MPYVESATIFSDKSQETTVFGGRQKVTSETEVRKVMVGLEM